MTANVIYPKSFHLQMFLRQMTKLTLIVIWLTKELIDGYKCLLILFSYNMALYILCRLIYFHFSFLWFWRIKNREKNVTYCHRRIHGTIWVRLDFRGVETDGLQNEKERIHLYLNRYTKGFVGLTGLRSQVSCPSLNWSVLLLRDFVFRLCSKPKWLKLFINLNVLNISLITSNY